MSKTRIAYKNESLACSSKYEKNEEDGITVVFNPQVYIQRYLAVVDTLSDARFQNYIRTVADFGCSTMKLFKYLKRLTFIERIMEVDIDEESLESHYILKPLMCDHLVPRESPLTVEVFLGSISDRDKRLHDVDAVICIELIEHLHQEVLEQVPSTVFGFMRPNVALFTTPNAEFNVVFNCAGFRHEDHKFEWTRQEFQSWCKRITTEYDDYDVYFVDIGPGPEQTEHLGFSTQMAVFYRKIMSLPSSVSDDMLLENEHPYKLVASYRYPCFVDNRSKEECFKDELSYYVYKYTYYEEYMSEDGISAFVPFSKLLDHVKKWCSDVEELKCMIEKTDWQIERRNEEYFVVSKIEDSSSESDWGYDDTKEGE